MIALSQLTSHALEALCIRLAGPAAAAAAAAAAAVVAGSAGVPVAGVGFVVDVGVDIEHLEPMQGILLQSNRHTEPETRRPQG